MLVTGDLQLERGHAREEEIRDFCWDKIAYFKVHQCVRFVEAFPMTVSGKVQKFIIREQKIRERGHEGVARIRTA